jgi:RNA polymerase sigma factor (TIGR02999 family)
MPGRLVNAEIARVSNSYFPSVAHYLAAVADITLILDELGKDDGDPSGALLTQVYAELRTIARTKMAAERPGDTLQPTALVHEAWLRLGDQRFANRAHFFSAAAEAMRRILIDSARRRAAARNGGGMAHVSVDEVEIAAPAKDEELLAIHDRLDALAEHDRRKAELVKLRYFAGLTIAEAADVLGISAPTAKRDWTYARAWLFRTIGAAAT